MSLSNQPDYLFVSREYLQDIEDYVRRGRIKILDDRHKYSTNNIQIPFNFSIEELFRSKDSTKVKLPPQFYQEKREQIIKTKSMKSSQSQQSFFYSRHNEFMNLNDFLEFYNKFLLKRKEENEKLHYKRKFANEVVKIRRIKTDRFMQTESLKLDNKVTDKDKARLDQKLVMFLSGLDYALDKLNYQQAEKMLRKLNTVPQPPLNSKLGERTRLYTIKTGGNLYRALGHILDQRCANGEIEEPDNKEIIQNFDGMMNLYGNKYGEVVKENLQRRIGSTMNILDHFLTNKPINKKIRGISTHVTSTQQSGRKRPTSVFNVNFASGLKDGSTKKKFRIRNSEIDPEEDFKRLLLEDDKKQGFKQHTENNIQSMNKKMMEFKTVSRQIKEMSMQQIAKLNKYPTAVANTQISQNIGSVSNQQG